MYSIPAKKKEVIADWVEFFVSTTKEELSKSELASYFEEAFGSEPSEESINDVWLELGERAIMYGEPPPFTVLPRLIQPNVMWEGRPEYLTCLIFALEGNPIDTTSSGVMFERIIGEAVKRYIGGHSITVGHPNTRRAEDIANWMNETFIHEPPGFRQDRNLDVVAWKPFEDGRANQIVVLLQCAAGHNWSSKTKELSLNAWKKYIHFACDPLKGFAIPILITDTERWEDSSSDAGLILDRARIYRNLDVNLLPAELRGELRTWCEGRLASMMS